MTRLAIGLMSGTSLDGVDAALVDLTQPDRVTLRHFHCRPYSSEERAKLLAAMSTGTARDLALLNVELGGWLADAAMAVLEGAKVEAGSLAFIASHGQTVWHEPGKATLQLGDAAVIAERLGVTVVSDFRSRDVAAGGQGAPLVPMADAMLFGREDGPRVLLNIGGMANVSFVPRRGAIDGVIAFDTGPGVAVIDAVARSLDGTAAFDVGGARAARGKAVASVVDRHLAHPYFALKPPKSTGREAFGAPLADDIVRATRAAGGSDDDCLATAVALTARSIADQCRRWLPAQLGEIVMSGGGTRNGALVAALSRLLPGVAVASFDSLFFDGDAKEAVAFAYLGHLTLEGRAGNVPTATGAKGPRVLGRVTPK